MKKIMVIGISAIMLLTGCSIEGLTDGSNLPSIPDMSGVTDPSVLASAAQSAAESFAADTGLFDYTAAVEAIDTFQDSFGSYVLDVGGAGETIHSTGTTLLGEAYNAVFYRSNDGVYEKASFEVVRDGIMMCDEYFRMTDDLVFVSRGYINENSEAVIERYLLSHGNCYSLDDVNQTIVRIDDPSSIDLYSTFAQVREICGVE